MKTMKKCITILMLISLMPGLFGCAGYHKIICENKKEWKGLKSFYKEGDNVIIYYQVDATESTLNIVVDGEAVEYDFMPEYGYRVEFTMPDHDVEIKAVWTRDSNGA